MTQKEVLTMGRDQSKYAGYRADWNSKNTKLISLRLAANTDGDMIEYLEKKENVAGYLRSLIRADMEAQKQE